MLIPIGDEIKGIEKWTKIPEFLIPEAKQQYLISTWGRFYNDETKRILPQNTNYDKDKYITVRLSHKDDPKQGIFVQPHRIVLMTYNYIQGCEELDVNHLDGIKYHNWIWNLEWATRKENINHAINTGLFALGEIRDNTKLTELQVHQICKMIEAGMKPLEIEKALNIEGCNISKIVQNIKGGRSWKYISSQYDFSNAFHRGI